VELVVLM